VKQRSQKQLGAVVQEETSENMEKEPHQNSSQRGRPNHLATVEKGKDQIPNLPAKSSIAIGPKTE